MPTLFDDAATGFDAAVLFDGVTTSSDTATGTDTATSVRLATADTATLLEGQSLVAPGAPTDQDTVHAAETESITVTGPPPVIIIYRPTTVRTDSRTTVATNSRTTVRTNTQTTWSSDAD